MIDRPIPAKIIFPLANKKTKGDDFISLATSLYRQHLIFLEPRELRINKDVLELTVTFRDIHSFKNWMHNTFIKEMYTKTFSKFLTAKPKTFREKNVIIEMDDIRNCTCKKSDFYILYGRYAQFGGELICSNCRGEISYSKIPLEIELEDWQTKYERVYSNWLESGLFEKEAAKELTNYRKGKLNLEGEKIRKQLSDFFKIPVYRYYFVEDEYENKNHSCPICGAEGSDSGVKKLKKICKTCNTIFEQEDI
jgi:ribosomal protein S27AE